MIPQKKAEKGLNTDHVQIQSSNQTPAPQEEVKAQHNRQESKRDVQNLTTLVNSHRAIKIKAISLICQPLITIKSRFIST